MPDHTCEVVVVHCMDARLQKPINDWLQRRFSLSDYDVISLAGGVYEMDMILKQIQISHQRHHTRRAILINHENCGMYGDQSTFERHAADLHLAEEKIKEILPEMQVELYYQHLTGIIEKVPGRCP